MEKGGIKMPQIKATRMELLKTKKKLKLAEHGHKLLKEKRDALIMEFFSTLREIKQLRKQIGNKLLEAENALQRAEALQGIHNIERIALGIAEEPTIEMTTKNVMSVLVPSVKEVKTKVEWFGFFESTSELNYAVKTYRELLPTLVKLCAKQLALQKLAEEIQKTKRKVNSLEYIIIPKIKKTQKSIKFKLEEMERENFTRLKKIKEATQK
ncbi:MAG: V-type ATP synthase subunit D [Candidatus Iainarchaeum archaeon]|uniref:A-type ATP synthase subunit D n=1 Tax=Candidatus Iainarchaeum sp. TaxID=3101447 RepID=A0A497JHU6_9ARCH|nr:MAG: V-type ATP synthase subunit D [Candidatus Diapherotrites archaeon]